MSGRDADGRRSGLARLGALALFAWIWLAPDAIADDLPEAVRADADRAFSEWRLRDLDEILRGATTALDQEPVRVRDLFWRPDRVHSLDAPEASAPQGADSLSRRRWRWLAAGGVGPEGTPVDYPVPLEGEAEPYPRITALVVDRVRREREGVTSLAREDAVAGAAWAEGHLRGTRRAVFRPAAPGAEEVRDLERATSRNRALGLACVGALVLAGVLALRATRRPRGLRADAPPP